MLQLPLLADFTRYPNFLLCVLYIAEQSNHEESSQQRRESRHKGGDGCAVPCPPPDCPSWPHLPCWAAILPPSQLPSLPCPQTPVHSWPGREGGSGRGMPPGAAGSCTGPAGVCPAGERVGWDDGRCMKTLWWFCILLDECRLLQPLYNNLHMTESKPQAGS